LRAAVPEGIPAVTFNSSVPVGRVRPLAALLDVLTEGLLDWLAVRAGHGPVNDFVTQSVKGGVFCRQFFCAGPLIVRAKVAENGDYAVQDTGRPGVVDGFRLRGHGVFPAADIENDPVVFAEVWDRD
jgi:hypothetical protein